MNNTLTEIVSPLYMVRNRYLSREKNKITLHMFINQHSKQVRMPYYVYPIDGKPFQKDQKEYVQINIPISSSARQILYKETPVFSVETNVHDLLLFQQSQCRQMIGTSEVLLFHSKDELPASHETVLFVFMEFSLYQDRILMDFFELSMDEFKAKTDAFYKSTSKFVVLDIDKTILLSDGDCSLDQKLAFESDMYIFGCLAITGQSFCHMMMIRKGLYEFLVEVQQIATIFFLTAGDLHYGRTIIDKLNQQNWKPLAEQSVGPLTEQKVFVPLTNVFSVRNHKRTVLKKRFDRVLPLLHLYPSVRYMGVDDDIHAWDESDALRIVPIDPFIPSQHDSPFSMVLEQLKLI
jgi:hypothetical protein